jgi:hypothetical protein
MKFKKLTEEGIMKKYIILFLIFTYQVTVTSQADTLLIEELNKISSINKPTRGMTMIQVVSKFGEPQFKKKAIGKPPITQWLYSDFIVYFENQWVIQTVVVKQDKTLN